MDIQNFPKGTKLISAGEKVNRLYVVYRGDVQQTWGDISVKLGPGTIVGLSDAFDTSYASDYSCVDEVSAFPVFYEGVDDFSRIFDEMPVFIFGFAKGAFRQCRDIFNIYDEKMALADRLYNYLQEVYEAYGLLCSDYGAEKRALKQLENTGELRLEDRIQKWEHDYIDCLNSVDNKEIENIYGKREEVVIGIIGICNGYMKRAAEAIDIANEYLAHLANIMLSPKRMDLFSLLYELRVYVAQRRINPQIIEEMMEDLYDISTDCGLFDPSLIKEKFVVYKTHNFHEDTQRFENEQEIEQGMYEDTFLHICEYAGMGIEWTEKTREVFNAYIALADRDGKEDETRIIRRQSVDAFYELYTAAFFKSVKRYELSPIVNMFLNFGFISIEAVGPELADELMEATDRLFLSQSQNVYTIYTWLRKIYSGENEPSKNEFDLDYKAFLLEEKKNGNITDSEMSRKLEDKEAKVRFEIENFFKSANRITSGRMTSFCPILTADGFGAEVARMQVTAEKINSALSAIEKVDYGIFYRDSYYTDFENGIKNELVKNRIMPDIILLPNVGSRSMLWQECSGRKVDTPARFIMPLFTLDDIYKMVLYCCGSFRWEICRREQGTRWNDIQSYCLTSDFYDYFTFYRKNKDLNPEQKEKVKSLLKSSRNNMREAFAKIYVLWIIYEATGSIRLNKVEREILCKYCTFSKDIREKMQDNPLYSELLSRFKIKTEQNRTHLKNVIDKLSKSGVNVPKELKDMEKFLQM